MPCQEAVADMSVEQPEADLVEGGADGVDLRDDVDAVPILLDHPRHASDLSLDLREALEELLSRSGVAARLGRHRPSSRWIPHQGMPSPGDQRAQTPTGR